MCPDTTGLLRVTEDKRGAAIERDSKGCDSPQHKSPTHDVNRLIVDLVRVFLT